MAFRILPATAEDLQEDMAITFAKAMAADTFWQAINGPDCTFEEECAFIEQSLAPSVGAGVELGASQIWKAVDGDGKLIGLAGLGIPMPLAAEQRAMLRTKFDFPPGRNEALAQWFETTVLVSIDRYGYDPSRHFLRQTTMVLPEYQRKGVGRMLTEKLNAIADERGAPTYARARPGVAGLFRKMGYEVLERIDFDLADFGEKLEGKETKTAFFALRRMPGAKDEKEATLDWS